MFVFLIGIFKILFVGPLILAMYQIFRQMLSTMSTMQHYMPYKYCMLKARLYVTQPYIEKMPLKNSWNSTMIESYNLSNVIMLSK